MSITDRQLDIFDFIDTCPGPKTENPYPETKFEQIFEVVNDPVICCTNCLCQYCTHNAEELYHTVKLAEAAQEPCFNCDECRIYGGDCKLKNRQKWDCTEFIMSDYGARRNQRRIKLM